MDKKAFLSLFLISRERRKNFEGEANEISICARVNERARSITRACMRVHMWAGGVHTIVTDFVIRYHCLSKQYEKRETWIHAHDAREDVKPSTAACTDFSMACIRVESFQILCLGFECFWSLIGALYLTYCICIILLCIAVYRAVS